MPARGCGDLRSAPGPALGARLQGPCMLGEPGSRGPGLGPPPLLCVWP